MIGASLTVVVPCFNEAEIIREVHRSLVESLATVCESLEFVYVDDGSVDATLDLLRDFCRADSRVKVVSLSRNFGQEAAQIAGLAAASGDAVVVMDADLQDTPEVVHDMLERWRNGADVVYAVRTRREGESMLKRGMAAAFYRVQRRLAPFDMPLNAGNFRLMDRRVVDTVLAMPDRLPFLRGMTPWAGFRHEPTYFRRRPALKARKSKYNLRLSAKVATDAFLSFHATPARFALLTGVLLLALAVLALPLGDAAARMLGGGSAGWKIVLVAFLGVSGVQLLAIGLLGEQLGRVQQEAVGRPLYVVKERLGFDASTVAGADSKGDGP